MLIYFTIILFMAKRKHVLLGTKMVKEPTHTIGSDVHIESSRQENMHEQADV